MREPFTVACAQLEPVVFDRDATIEKLARGAAEAAGKGASLAAMTRAGLNVPPGFVVAAEVLEAAGDAERLRALARARDHAAAQALAGSAEPPPVAEAYERLGGGQVAVRSSACAEDSEAASFAGQQDTYLAI